MPEVHASIFVAAPLDQVYALAKDIEGLAGYIKDVEAVTVVEREGARTVTDWVGVIREFRRQVRWREADEWDDEARECRFEQIRGDFDEYRGVWRFSADGDGTVSTLQLVYRLEIPLVGPLIQKLIRTKVQQSCDNILKGLRQRAEQVEARG